MVKRHINSAAVLLVLTIIVEGAFAQGSIIDYGPVLRVDIPGAFNRGMAEAQERRMQQLRMMQIQQEMQRQEDARREAEQARAREIEARKLAEENERRAAIEVTKEAATPQVKSPVAAFAAQPNGANLLALIEFAKADGAPVQPENVLGQYFLMGYFSGALNANATLIYDAIEIFVEAAPSVEKSKNKKKLSAADERAIGRSDAALRLAPADLLNEPTGVTHVQRWAIVEKYLKEHPERLHLGASLLITESLSIAYAGLASK